MPRDRNYGAAAAVSANPLQNAALKVWVILSGFGRDNPQKERLPSAGN
jgi:hypothetical protein